MIKECCLLALVLVGCGGVSQVPVETARSLREGRVAVAFYNIDKRIEYSELVYKVFWNETRRQNAAFAGLWDVDAELTKVVAARLHDLSIRAFDWSDALAADDRHAALRTLCPSVTGEETTIAPLSPQLRRSLRAHDASHFILWCTGAQQVDVAAFNAAASLAWPGRLFLFEASSGRLLHTEWLVPQQRLHYSGSVREIEAHGMAKLRQNSAAAVTNTVVLELAHILRAPAERSPQPVEQGSATPGGPKGVDEADARPKPVDVPAERTAHISPEVVPGQITAGGEEHGPGGQAEATQDATASPRP